MASVPALHLRCHFATPNHLRPVVPKQDQRPLLTDLLQTWKEGGRILLKIHRDLMLGRRHYGAQIKTHQCHEPPLIRAILHRFIRQKQEIKLCSPNHGSHSKRHHKLLVPHDSLLLKTFPTHPHQQSLVKHQLKVLKYSPQVKATILLCNRRQDRYHRSSLLQK
jgi:hypothetical protein